MLKKLFFCTIAVLVMFNVHATTETLQWYVDGNLYTTTTCESGGDVILPAAPTKTGYNFDGWTLPYTEIEYLESTGTQWIDTGYTPNFKTTKIKTSLIFNGDTSTRYCIFGTGATSTASRFWLYNSILSEYSGQWEVGLGPHQNFLDYIEPNKIISIEYIPKNTSQYVVKIDNNEHILDITNYGSTLGNIYIYNNNRLENENVSCLKAIMKLYYFQIYDNNILVRDFIPVLDTSGIPCMYDKVSEQFFYNQGTGQFIAGPVIQ